MKAALRIYSDILQLRRDTIAALFATPAGIAFAFKMFFIVLLIAGLGRWFGIPVVIQKPVLSEEINNLTQMFDRTSTEAIILADQAMISISQENISRLINDAINDLIADGIEITADTLGKALAEAGVTEAAMRDMLDDVAAVPEQFGITAEQVAAAQAQLVAEAEGALVSSATIDLLLEELDLTPAQLTMLLDRAPDLAAIAAEAEAESVAASEELMATLAQIPITPAEIRQYLTDLIVTPERVTNFSYGIGLTDEQRAAAHAELKDSTSRINAALMSAQSEATLLEPPLGTRTSRVIRLLGEWLATPFAVIAEWLIFALFALFAARLLGGRGTVAQHLAAIALAAAPAVLLLVSYIPEMRTILPSFTYDYAIATFGRVLTLLAVIWMALILLKTLAVSHDFSLWRAAATLVVTWLIVWVIIPVASTMGMWYLLRG